MLSSENMFALLDCNDNTQEVRESRCFSKVQLKSILDKFSNVDSYSRHLTWMIVYCCTYTLYFIFIVMRLHFTQDIIRHIISDIY